MNNIPPPRVQASFAFGLGEAMALLQDNLALLVYARGNFHVRFVYTLDACRIRPAYL